MSDLVRAALRAEPALTLAYYALAGVLVGYFAFQLLKLA